MTAPTLADYRWLASPAAEPWLTRAAAHEGKLTLLANSLRRELSPSQTHLVLEQVELRRRAKEKFSRPEQMLFTKRALEQSSGELLARYKASRFAVGEAVLDLCCGIGGDLLALAARGPAAGLDSDPIMALLAEHNCQVMAGHSTQLGTPRRAFPTTVHCSNAADANLAEFAAWHIDPDRREGGTRTTRVELYEPGLEVIEKLRLACDTAAVKLAPAAMAPEPWSAEAELEWIGDRAECRQQVAWFGSLARHPGRRTATVLFHGQLGPSPQPSPRSTGEREQTIITRTVVGDAHGELSKAASVGRFVFEPRPAIMAARLADVLAAEYALLSIADHGGYLTGDSPVSDDALSSFEVTEVMPFDLRRIKAWLRERSIGRLEIKLRGVKEEPERIRASLKVPGEESATLLITRFGGGAVAILARRSGGA